MSVTRRDIFKGAGGILAATAANAMSSKSVTKTKEGTKISNRQKGSIVTSEIVRVFNGVYEGDHLDQIAFPLGGIGAGMFCLEGTGALTKFSLRNRPDLSNEPHAFATVCLKGTRNIARVLEG